MKKVRDWLTRYWLLVAATVPWLIPIIVKLCEIQEQVCPGGVCPIH